MCGIAGVINFNNVKPDTNILKSAVDMLYNRGPDDAGVWQEDNAGLAHRRLSILDLSPAGHQPMLSDDGRYVIVYNGEVYNFMELRGQLNEPGRIWRSRSDTEVILRSYERWGEDCLGHFHGMFSFVIWDRKEKRIFAARDRMGVKPFYYHYSQSGFIFASRPRAIFALSRELSKEIDAQALRLYLESGYVPAPCSIHKNLRKLEPAHYLIINSRGLAVKRYWDFRGITTEYSWSKRREDDLLDELEEVIARSVKLRMISDVELGAFLSGGIDSSLVTAMMKKSGSGGMIKTFNIGFKEKERDESLNARNVAKCLGTEHYCEYISSDDLLELLPNFIEEYDEPFFDNSAFAVMAVSRMARKYVSVSLSGDGGDELFGGYHYYNIIRQIGLIFKLPPGLRQKISSLLSYFPAHKAKLCSAAVNQADIISAFIFLRSIMKDFDNVLSADILERTIGLKEFLHKGAENFAKNLHPCEKGMRLDASYTLADDYLQKVDVASMAFSLECRQPLLDHKLVEWAMKLPVSWKLKGNVNKYLLKKLAYRYAPRAILDRPKKGFGLSIETWLRGPLRGWAENRFNDRELFRGLPLEQEKVLKLWKLHLSGARNAQSLLWALLMLLNFKQKHL